MDFTVNRDLLLPILNRVVGVVERRQTIPILGNLLLRAEGNAVTITGTDLEVEIRACCDAAVFEGGESTVPARKFVDICRSLAEGAVLKVRVSGDRCFMAAERGRYVLGTLPAQDFPSVDSQGVDENVEIDESALKRVFDKTAFAMAQQDVRYYLNGLLVEFAGSGVRAVATDGHRLATFEYPCALDVSSIRSVIVPHKTVTELRRQFVSEGTPVGIQFSDRFIRFSVGKTITSSKLVDGRYPDFRRVLPAGLSKTAVADRETLKRALARTAILSNEKFRGVRLVFEPGLLRLVAHNPEQDEAVEDMEIAYDGVATTVGFNVGYLSELLAAIDTEQVSVVFEDGSTSSLWRGMGAMEETYVVMPMRL